MTRPVRRSILLLLLSLIALSKGAIAAERPPSGFRLITYNVWYGFTRVPDRKAAYLEWMKAQAPDIVTLQELNGYTEEKLVQDAESWGHSHSVLLKTKRLSDWNHLS